MADVDISDLPAPTDISDLPTPAPGDGYEVDPATGQQQWDSLNAAANARADVDDPAESAAQVGLHYVSHAAGGLAGGLTYLGALGAAGAQRLVTGDKSIHPTDIAAGVQQDTENALAVEPVTAGGKRMLAQTQGALAPVAKKAQELQDRSGESAYQNGIPIPGLGNVGAGTAWAGAYGTVLPAAVSYLFGGSAAKEAFDDVPLPAREVPPAPVSSIEPPPSGVFTKEQLAREPDPFAPTTPPDTPPAPTAPAPQPSTHPAAATPQAAPPTAPQAGPTLGQRIGGGKQRGGPRFSPPSETEPPKDEPPTPPVPFDKPSAEGYQAGDRTLDQQLQRVAVLQALHRISGGAMPEVPTSAVTGNTQESGNDWTYAKDTSTPAGARMAGVIATTQHALRTAMQRVVSGTGDIQDGVSPIANQARGRVLNDAIGSTQDYYENGKDAVYQAADGVAKGVPMSFQTDMPSTRALLSDPSNFPGTQGDSVHKDLMARGQSLGLIPRADDAAPITDAEKRIRAAGLTPPSPVAVPTAKEAETWRQFSGQLWSPQTHATVQSFKDAVDDDVARHVSKITGDPSLYDAARKMNSEYNARLNRPGIVKLLKPKNGEEVHRRVDIPDLPDRIADLPLNQFQHVVKLMKASARGLPGAPPEVADKNVAGLNALKGHIAQRLLDAGLPNNKTNSLSGIWNPKNFHAALQNYSLKLPWLFSPEELRHLQVINRAGNILRKDEQFKGSTIEAQSIGAADRIRAGFGVAAHGLADLGAHHALPVVGPIVAEGIGIPKFVSKVIGGNPEAKAQAKRLAEVEKRITKLSDPSGAGPTLGQKIGGSKQRGDEEVPF